MAPVFSVVIPTYNQADYLRVALQSVLEQTYQDYEVIVVNNFSTDPTLDVIRQVKDPRVRIINYQNRGIIGAGRNVGIRASQGSYIAFLDSDDAWYPKKLERVAEAISADPQVGLICHDQDIFRDGEKASVARHGPRPGFKGNPYEYMLLIGNCVSTSAAVVARRYLDEVGNFSEDPELATVEDYDLWLKLSRVCRFQYLHEILGAHNYHPASASARTELHLKATLAVLECHSQRVQDAHRPAFKRAIRRRYAGAFYGAARQHHRRGALKRTLAYYARTIKTYPLYLRAYVALTLFFVDFFLGQSRRRRIVRALWPGSWPASWTMV